MKKFFQTAEKDYTLLILRVGSGLAMLPFGLMKLGVLGGGSFGATLEAMNGMGISSLIAVLVTAAESVGAVSLAVGFCTRFCAASLALIMAGAVYFTFGMGYINGYALPLVLLVMYVPSAIYGAGAYAADSVIAKKLS